MRKTVALLVIAAVALGVLLVLVRSQSTGETTLSAADPQPQATPDSVVDTAEAGPAAIESTLDAPVAPSDARGATMLQLADGDSFDILWSDTGEFDEVRLLGINAPEANACFGQAARGVLQELAADEQLVIETVQRDEFGRAIANVWVQGVFVNATLVELGAALALSDGGSHADLIVQAQTVAQSAGAGLWAGDACAADPAILVGIATIEYDAPGRDNQNPNGEWIEIVNLAESPADLTDWSIRDESTRHRYFFPSGFELGANGSVRVFSGCGEDTDDDLYWCGRDPVWNNGGDTGFLLDEQGRFVDTYSYIG